MKDHHHHQQQQQQHDAGQLKVAEDDESTVASADVNFKKESQLQLIDKGTEDDTGAATTTNTASTTTTAEPASVANSSQEELKQHQLMLLEDTKEEEEEEEEHFTVGSSGPCPARSGTEKDQQLPVLLGGLAFLPIGSDTSEAGLVWPLACVHAVMGLPISQDLPVHCRSLPGAFHVQGHNVPNLSYVPSPPLEDLEAPSQVPERDTRTDNCRVVPDDNLVEARAVEEMNSPFVVASHHNEELTKRSLEKLQESHKKLSIYFALMLLFGITAVMMVLWATGAFVNHNNDPSLDNNNIDTAFYVDDRSYLKLFLPNETLSSIVLSDKHNDDVEVSEDQPTPQTLAFQWLVQDPALRQYSPGRLRQRFALATFFHAMNGKLWTKKNGWLSYDIHECYWYHAPRFDFIQRGLIKSESPCHRIYNDSSNNENENNNSRKLQSVNLSINNDTIDNGDQNATQIDDWTYKLLGMRQNNMDGTTIPDELFWLTDLQSIDFSWSKLQGTLSSNISKLTNLRELNIPATYMSGRIPSEIGLNTELKLLFFGGLARNQTLHSLPTELGKLTDMEQMIFARTPYKGVIPFEVGLMTSLILFAMSFTDVTGTIPKEMGKLANLRYCYINSNRLMEGPVPSELGLLEKMVYLHLNDNGVTGALPLEVAHMTELQELRLDGNSMTGSIPTDVANLKRMYLLDLGGNGFTGTLPATSMGQMSSLATVRLTQNRFTGPLPSQIGLLLKLKALDFSYNGLSGTLPTQLGN